MSCREPDTSAFEGKSIFVSLLHQRLRPSSSAINNTFIHVSVVRIRSARLTVVSHCRQFHSAVGLSCFVSVFSCFWQIARANEFPAFRLFPLQSFYLFIFYVFHRERKAKIPSGAIGIQPSARIHFRREAFRQSFYIYLQEFASSGTYSIRRT